MSERDDEPFDIEDEFIAEAEDDDRDLDKFLDKRPKPGQKKGKAAWSRVEDVLAERRLQRELRESYGDDE